MKLTLFLILCIFPFFVFAQRDINLHINQPPELGFVLNKQDTTIQKGGSVVLDAGLIISGGEGDYLYSWYPSETLNNSNILKPVASPAETTTYVLTVFDEGGCSFSIDYTVKVNLGVAIEDVGLNNYFTAILYPNPNLGEFKVNLNGPPAPKIEMYIYDSGGKVIKTQIIKNFSGNHTENIQIKLVSGVYTLLINSKEKNLSRQFIIL
jgi:hypothetical protein